MLILRNDIPCCLVMDTSALLTESMDMPRFLTESLPHSPHVLVVPHDVLTELRGLTNNTSSHKAERAEAVLRALARFPDFASAKPASASTQPPLHSSSSSSASPNAGKKRNANASPTSFASLRGNAGVAVLQRSKETYYPLVKFARNLDTKIVACAYHFTREVDNEATAGVALGDADREDSDSGNEGGSGASPRLYECRHAFFVTNDVVQQIKASPYKIRTIDSAALKLHWDHLGHWDI